MPAHITLTILQADSLTGSASPELVQIVNKANAEEKRPIGDRVTVISAEIINYSINAKLYIGKDPEAATVLAQAINNVTDYAKKQNVLVDLFVCLQFMQLYMLMVLIEWSYLIQLQMLF